MCARGQLRLYQPATKVSAYNNYSFPRTTQEWNILPTRVTYTPTLEEFSTSMLALQSYLIYRHGMFLPVFFYFTFLILTLEGRKLLSPSPLLAK